MMFESGIIASTRHGATMRKSSCKNTQHAEQVELSLDSDVLDALQATGEDWEAHFNAILREWLRTNARLV
ncbi:MAG: BrnA antitoxin family protein [Betaproteobacteria bacterium]|nr:BrnA antitoxin family protein [Betaproteobacteria bacterium]